MSQAVINTQIIVKLFINNFLKSFDIEKPFIILSQDTVIVDPIPIKSYIVTLNSFLRILGCEGQSKSNYLSSTSLDQELLYPKECIYP